MPLIEAHHMTNPSANLIAATPRPPYYAVVFTSLRSSGDEAAYAQMAQRMIELAAEQPGFLGVESARSADGAGITVSYWTSLDDIGRWKQHLEHQAAQQQGRKKWYRQYSLRIARVESDYGFSADGATSRRK